MMGREQGLDAVNRRYSGGLRSAVLVALAALAPLAAFAGLAAYVALHSKQAELSALTVQTARVLSERVDRELKADMDEAGLIAALPALDPHGDPAQFREVARREIARHPDWRAVILLDPQGRWLFNTNSDQQRSAVDADSFRELARTGQPVVGDLVKGPRGRWAMAVRAPVIRDGKLISVVSITREPASLHALMASMRLPAAWYVAIVNREEHIVARSQGEDRFLGAQPSAESREARARGVGGGLYRGRALEGFRTHSAYWLSPATGWSVHVGVPEPVFDAPLRQMTAVLVGGFVVCLLLAVALVALWVTDFEARRAQAATIEQATRMDALGRLTGGVAHDFNNLLTVIQGNAEMLSRRLQDHPGAERPLAAIRQASDRAAGLIRQLLVFARGGAAERTVLDLGQVIEQASAGMAQLAGDGVVIYIEIEEGAAPISADRLQLEAALLNLVANARDAMSNRGRIDITVRPRGGEVLISVQDTGPGFDKAVLPRIFDPFFTTKAVGRGTGLGLSQVYGFVKGVGGRVEAGNAAAGGALVRLVFPAAERSHQARPEPAWPAASIDGQAQILLVDDNDEVRSTAAAFLRDCNFAVAEAVDGPQALQVLEQRRVQAVVSDIVMPGGYDGIALAEVIAELRPDLPVLLVSGYSERAADAQARGFTVLHKPYDLPDLERRLRRLIGREGAVPN